MKKYHLIAYKENEDNYCMGCHMYSTNSDCQIYLNMSEDYLIKKWAELENSGGYVFQVICGGVPFNESEHSYDPDFGISSKTARVFNSFSDRVTVLVRKMKKKEEQEAIKKAELDARKKAEDLKKSELALFESLRQKYQ